MESVNDIEPMEAIVLAAGYSSRADAFKMALKLGHKTVLEHTVSKFEGICKTVIIVGGYQFNRIQELVNEMQESNKYSFTIKCIFNENFDHGMFSSIQKGCREVQAPAFFMTPGDCPLVCKDSIDRLTKETGDVVIPSYRLKGGHPIKLSSVVKKHILEENKNGILRDILKAFHKQYVNVDDPGVLMDMDTPDDYKRALEYFQHNHTLHRF